MKRHESAENNTEATPPGAAAEAEPSSDSCNPQETNELESTKIELGKYKDLALRCQAELDNYRKRVARDKEDTIRYANTALLEQLLPILDSFELGLEAAKNATDASGIFQGMSMVRKQLADFLKENGVQSVEGTGLFDPNLHDAVAHEHSEDVPSGHVIRQMRRGYKLKDRLLRPSSVVVSKGT